MYLIHQFILIYLYYYNSTIFIMDPLILPFVILGLTLIGSYIMVSILWYTPIKSYIA